MKFSYPSGRNVKCYLVKTLRLDISDNVFILHSLMIASLAGYRILGWKFFQDFEAIVLLCVCEVAQSCPTLCDPVDCSPPGSSVHGILQARILEWVAISFSRGSSQPRDQARVSCFAGRRFILSATREAWCSTICFLLWIYLHLLQWTFIRPLSV